MCDLTETVELTLPIDLRSSGEARQFVEAATCRTHHANVLDEVKLLVSELVTNAVKHGAPPITVRIECDGTLGLKVSVGDNSPELVARRSADSLDENGRGLTLVDLISSEWGVEPSETGKAVWFSIRSENPDVAYVS